MKLTPRKEKILTAIVHEYTKTAEPVSSASLVRVFRFPWSSATVRAEMSALEASGFIYQPHTSAGRVPTDMGFRYYVNLIEGKLGKRSEEREEKAISNAVKEQTDFDAALRNAVLTLSELTRTLALAASRENVFYHGLSNVISEPEYSERPRAQGLAEILDETESLFAGLPQNNFGIFIGPELPVGKSANCALIVSSFRSPGSDTARIAVIGPMRLSYERIAPLVRYTAQLMEDLYE